MLWRDLLASIDATSALICLTTFVMVYFLTRRQNGIPPGPNPLPILGNIHVLANTDMLGTLAKLRHTYGDIFGLYIGGKLTIFLNGFETIHEAFLKKGSIFKGRPKSNWYDDKGIFFTNDSLWKEQRGFSQKSLNAICFTDRSKHISSIIAGEIEDLTSRLGSYSEPFDLEHYLTLSVSNVAMQVVFGHKCDLDDTDLAQCLNVLRGTSTDFFIREAVFSCLPLLSYLPACMILDRRSKLLNFVNDYIKRGKEQTQKENNDCLSFVSLYTKQMASNKENGTNSSLTEENMQMTANHLLSGGSDTTSGTIQWTILHLIRHPEIQEKMFQEMQNLIDDGIVEIKHRAALPYVQAVVLEGLRIAPVGPLGLPHSVSEDFRFRGYLFPKNCTVIGNISSTLNDPLVWPDPEVFRPERFLSEDGKDVIVPRQFIPFSLGPRSCVGESLARMQIFLYVCNIVKTFRLLPEVDGKVPPVTGVLGITYHPVPFKMRVTKRENKCPRGDR